MEALTKKNIEDWVHGLDDSVRICPKCIVVLLRKPISCDDPIPKIADLGMLYCPQCGQEF